MKRGLEVFVAAAVAFGCSAPKPSPPPTSERSFDPRQTVLLDCRTGPFSNEHNNIFIPDGEKKEFRVTRRDFPQDAPIILHSTAGYGLEVPEYIQGYMGDTVTEEGVDADSWKLLTEGVEVELVIGATSEGVSADIRSARCL